MRTLFDIGITGIADALIEILASSNPDTPIASAVFDMTRISSLGSVQSSIPRGRTRDPCRSHQPSNPLPADREAIGLQLSVNTRRAIGCMRSSVDRADMTRQTGVGGRPSRNWSAPPGVIARGRNLQDAGHCPNRIHGLVRAHEPVNPFGLALLSRANQAAAFARMSRS